MEVDMVIPYIPLTLIFMRCPHPADPQPALMAFTAMLLLSVRFLLTRTNNQNLTRACISSH